MHACSIVNEKDKKIKLGVVLPNLDHPWLIACEEYIIKAAKTLGDKCDLLIRYDSDTINDQIHDITALLMNKVDGMVIIPVNNLMPPTITDQIRSAKIPVGSISRQFSLNDFTIRVDGDIDYIAQSQVEFLVEKLNYSGNIAFISGVPDASDSKSMEMAFVRELKKHNEINLLAIRPGYFSTAKSKLVMKKLLREFKCLDAVCCFNDSMAIGANNAIKDADLDKEIFITGIGGNNEMLNLIKSENSSCISTSSYPPYMAGDAVYLVYLAIQKRGIASLFDSAPPAMYKVKSILLTKDNIDEYGSGY
ncbi:MAG: sugar ABC transporter substrate-binding protein [bacterium]|nr:sugar ABC transporter substrate-binding protein [bacterium]